MILEIEKNKL